MSAADDRRVAVVRQRLTALLAEPAEILPGTVVERWLRCGKPTCRCKAERPQLHGPYRQWGYSRERHKVTRWLSADQLDRYRAAFERGRRLGDLVSALDAAEIRRVERTEGWGA
jgi:hypothetical protein